MNTPELFDLSGKVSIITGGGDGLGRAMAIALAEAGSDIVICSRKVGKCEETAHEIEKLGVKALAVQCDSPKVMVVKSLFNSVKVLALGIDGMHAP